MSGDLSGDTGGDAGAWERVGLSFAVVDGVAVVSFDQPGAPVNTLNSRVGPHMQAVLARVASDPAITAMVLCSGKPDCWIAGADIEELGGVATAAQGEALARGGQALLDQVAALAKPVVAAIHGVALGAGCEVALACHARVLSDHPKTTLALPEVQLGLLPGAGGTQRLPRLIGLQAALGMILTGRTVRAKEALKLGLADELVHPAILRDVAIRRARAMAAGTVRPRRGGARSRAARWLEATPLGRALVFRQARATVLRKTGGHYPAPLEALAAVRTGVARGMAQGLQDEARRFGALTVDPVCKQLVALFFAINANKKATGLPDGVTATARPVRTLGVVGAGFMGAGIATVAVQGGLLVRLTDASVERAAAGWRTVRDAVRAQLRRRRLTPVEFDTTMARLSVADDQAGLAGAALVIEAVFEELAVKQEVRRAVEAAAPGAIFASNTSTIPIADIAAGAANPGTVIGMHFFSPVAKMPLLEVVVTPATAPETVATAVACGRQMGKTVIVVRDAPGFYVNRILAPYLAEAGRLLDEGAAMEAVDRACTAFGFPVGPFTLLDEVGLDVAGKAGPIMAAAYGARLAPAQALTRVVADGRLGRKAQRGFYRYDAAGKRQGPDPSVYALTAAGAPRRTVPAEEIRQRTILPLLNEAVRCLEEGIIASPRDGDIGAIFGVGFPPFRGGPFRYLDTLGAAAVVRDLEALDARFPGRFTPAARLRALADSGGRFHP